ncbi:MAG: hypothetical protein J1F67_02610 [Muribaculaceae bacterium]|nr:hypothetical protein [Muribaculaceae bacterium]
MLKKIKIEDINCVCVSGEDSKRIVYMIYPALVPFQDKWIEEMASKYQVPIVVIYIPADGWNDMLTPWPEPGETPDSPPFAGKAAETLKTIQEQLIPSAENALGLKNIEERNLIGVSLSGLFTFWQWMLCDTFKSIGCLSASFWYNGFLNWFEKQTLPPKNGKAYFLLGVKEPKAWIKAYRSVGENTEKIVEKLKESGIPTTFQWVPGDHFANPTERAEDALKGLFINT